MNLAQALKKKNRLAGELVRNQQILQRENARRSDNPSKVDRKAIWDRIITLSNELGTLKGKITQVNIGIYPAIEQMAELKSRITFIQGLQKREGDEKEYLGPSQEVITRVWDSFINQQKCDEMVALLQEEINTLQDVVDVYNATTTLPD